MILWSHSGYKWRVMPKIKFKKENVILPNLTSRLQNPAYSPPQLQKRKKKLKEKKKKKLKEKKKKKRKKRGK